MTIDKSPMKLFDEGVCEVCGKPGVHPECEESARRGEIAAREMDFGFVRKHAVNGSSGISDRLAYEIAKETLDTHLGWISDPDENDIIEADEWWYFNVGWIGVIGHVVEKTTNTVFPLGLNAHQNGPTSAH
jgi:hypothetical protein